MDSITEPSDLNLWLSLSDKSGERVRLRLSISKMIVEKCKEDLIRVGQPEKGTDVKLLIPLE